MSYRWIVVITVAARVASASRILGVFAFGGVSEYRAAAGLSPLCIDPAMSKVCMEHAKYMLLNRGTAAMVGLEAHTHRRDLPGATPAGAKCVKVAELFP